MLNDYEINLYYMIFLLYNLCKQTIPPGYTGLLILYCFMAYRLKWDIDDLLQEETVLKRSCQDVTTFLSYLLSIKESDTNLRIKNP